MGDMFHGASSLTNINGLAYWDTSSVTSMSVTENLPLTFSYVTHTFASVRSMPSTVRVWVGVVYLLMMPSYKKAPQDASYGATHQPKQSGAIRK